MIIEPTTDREVISALELASFEEHFLTAHTFGRATWWVITERGTPIGYAGAYMAQPENWCIIEHYGVIPEAQNRGVGRLLLARCISWGREQGAAGVSTYTMPYNIPSGRCLMRAGFQMFAPVWADRALLYWWLPL